MSMTTETPNNNKKCFKKNFKVYVANAEKLDIRR
jgi:hypothetical protein